MRLGIIGGSGFDDPTFFAKTEEKTVTTSYGAPSSTISFGRIAGLDVVLLSRHGKGHTVTPSHVNNRANIQALKDAGCTHIIATSAVGSLRQEIRRGDIVIPDQFIDFTKQRKFTFFDEFEEGDAKHTSMADPFDERLRKALVAAGKKTGATIHGTGTVITIEGPRFSTRAESRMYRIIGADIVNMSIAPECILANEAKIPYAAIAMSTDYDSWKEDETPVTWDEILKVFGQNVKTVKAIIEKTCALLHEQEMKAR